MLKLLIKKIRDMAQIKLKKIKREKTRNYVPFEISKIQDYLYRKNIDNIVKFVEALNEDEYLQEDVINSMKAAHLQGIDISYLGYDCFDKKYKLFY